MPGTNAGTGQPSWFQCRKCRKSKSRHTVHPYGPGYGGVDRVILTGRKRKHRDYPQEGVRSDSYMREYKCRVCDHIGWSRHRDLKHLEEKNAAL